VVLFNNHVTQQVMKQQIKLYLKFKLTINKMNLSLCKLYAELTLTLKLCYRLNMILAWNSLFIYDFGEVFCEFYMHVGELIVEK